MDSHCLFCRRSLPANDVLERFPLGRRVAYDPARGRLWAVCPACARWNLAPFEERWEVLEDLEKLGTDRARVLASTDNIALLRAPGLEIVKVGRAELKEESWWRYGTELLRRRKRSRVLGLVDFGTAITVGVWGAGPLVRELTFADAALRVPATCRRCGRAGFAGPRSVRGAFDLFLDVETDGRIALKHECGACARRGEVGWMVLSGSDAASVLRTTMAYRNFSGASPEVLNAATRRILASGSASEFVAAVARGRAQLREFRHDRFAAASVALEIALNEDLERRSLEGELAILERDWQRAEEIAAIADGELTPLPRPSTSG